MNLVVKLKLYLDQLLYKVSNTCNCESASPSQKRPACDPWGTTGTAFSLRTFKKRTHAVESNNFNVTVA